MPLRYSLSLFARKIVSQILVLILIGFWTALPVARAGTASGFGNDRWLPGFHVPGTDNLASHFAVRTIASGNEYAYIAGSFRKINSRSINNLARWDGVGWSSLPSSGYVEYGGTINQLAIDHQGNLLAAGSFSYQMGQSMKIARWDGSIWTPLGGQFNEFTQGIISGGGYGSALALASNGDLYAAGQWDSTFDHHAVARWNSSSGYWERLGAFFSTEVTSLIAAQEADGLVLYAGVKSTPGIYRYNSGLDIWEPFGSNTPGPVFTLKPGPDQKLYAGGSFSGKIARLDGGNWETLAGGLEGDVYGIEFDPAGNIYAAGCTSTSLSIWDGKSLSWTKIATFSDEIYTIAWDSQGNLMLGGKFLSINNTIYAGHIVSYNPVSNTFHTPGGGLGANKAVSRVAYASNGTLYALVSDNIGETVTEGLARWTGQGWQPMGTGRAAFTVGPGDNLYGLSYSDITGSTVWRWDWDQGAWSSLAQIKNFWANALSIDSDADHNGTEAGDDDLAIYVVGQHLNQEDYGEEGPGLYRVVKTEAGWTPSPIINGPITYFAASVSTIANNSQGELWVGGKFCLSAPCINGTFVNLAVYNPMNDQWTPVSTNDIVNVVKFDAEGTLYATGKFTQIGGVTASRIARRDTQTGKWEALYHLGGGEGLNAEGLNIETGPGGRVYVVGAFTTAGGWDHPANRIALWDDNAWYSLGSGITGSSSYAKVYSVAVHGQRLVASGDFTTAGGIPSSNIAMYDLNPWTPDGVSLSSSQFAENQVVVGSLSVVNPNPGEMFTYTLPSGQADNDLFELIGGRPPQIRAKAQLNYESDPHTYELTVHVVGSSGWVDNVPVSLTLQNVNEQPADVLLSNSSVSENEPVGTVVGILTGVDPDTNEIFSYSLVSGDSCADNALFRIEGDQLLTEQVLDYETGSTLSVCIGVSDSEGLMYQKAFILTVTDVDEKILTYLPVVAKD